MMLVIRTQYMENYGAHDWNGMGECPQYWKCKGGSEYKILGIPLNDNLAEIVASAKVERNDNYIREYIIDWTVESDDYISEFEKDQLEYDGFITFKEPIIEYADLLMKEVYE